MAALERYDTPLRARVPAWMMEGLEEVARRKRVRGISDPIRWAIEDLLAEEGITRPDQPAA